MRNPEELVSSLHQRMLWRQKKRENRLMTAIGTACAALTFCLIALVFGGSLHLVGTAGVYSGTSILFENAGPYVLTAILAFMVGVVVTVILLRGKKQENNNTDNKIEQGM